MEQQEKQFEAVLKKSVAMYSMLTGKPMTEREGRAFIEIFDMTEAYLASGANITGAAETFDILSQIDVRGPTDEEQKRRIAELVNNPPQFVGRLPDDATPVPRQEVYVDPASPDGDKSVLAEVETGDDGAKTVTRVEVAAEPVDICGCPFGRCTCTDKMLAKKKGYTPPPIQNHDRDHILGYDWQIVVLSREKDERDSYMVHYAEMPTQAQFIEHFVKFHERTHYVHVNEWVNYGWEGITERYDRSAPASSLTRKNEVVRTATAPELRGRDVSAPPVSSPWEEQDKAWRIRYYSDATGAVIFHYCDKRPTSAEMAHFHHAKCMAVSQARPKDAA